MSLLDSFTGNEDESGGEKSSALNSFTVHRTSNIQEFLKDISKKTNLPTQKIDFDLVMIKTEIKLPNANQFVDIDKEILGKLKEEDLLLDEKTVISQTYELSLKQAIKTKEFELIMQISANKTYSMAKAHIKKTSTIHYSPNLEKILIKDLNKRKIRSGILINLFDDEMIEGVKKLVTKIRVNDCLLDDYEIVLCRWPEPTPSVDDKIVKKHEEKIKEKKVDYADRAFITTIEEGEVALEYIKPKMGKAGRNFKGVFVPALEPKKTNEPKFVVDVQTIEKKEEADKIIYIAKAKGYVKVDDKELRIADKLEISEATFRSTGNIDARLDKDIKINLKSKEKHEDNVGPNTKISASEIMVEGSVANGAELRAEKLEIKGQTHKTSKIYADDAKIGLHKGFLNAKKAHIDKLENGEVVADYVMIEQAIGGTVRGKIVEIKELFSNVKIIASKEIKITGMIKGSDNHFIIEPAVTVDEREKLEALLKTIKDLEKKVKELQKIYLSKKDIFQQSQANIEGLKEIIASAKKSGRKPSQIHIDRYKQLTQGVHEAVQLKEELEILEEKLSNEKDEVSLIQDAAIHAKIINMGVWRTHNKVFYKLIQPEMKIEYIPKIGMNPSMLTLKMVGEEDFEVEVKYI